jgi:hypothetical protein
VIREYHRAEYRVKEVFSKLPGWGANIILGLEADSVCVLATRG